MLFLLFHVDQDAYALEASAIEAVLPVLRAKRIPQAPEAILGLIDYHGSPVPVVDITSLMLGRSSELRMSTRIVLVKQQSGEHAGRLLGLLVERATDTLSCEPSTFSSTGVTVPEAAYLGPVTAAPSGLVQWVTPDRLLTPAVASLLYQQPLST